MNPIIIENYDIRIFKIPRDEMNHTLQVEYSCRHCDQRPVRFKLGCYKFEELLLYHQAYFEAILEIHLMKCVNYRKSKYYSSEIK